MRCTQTSIRLLASSSFLFQFVAAQSCSPQDNVLITFYGYPDNDPPGAGIAYTQCGRSLAGGTGTYDDPISFATAADGPFTPCDIVYLPWVKKYARFEDTCAQCAQDWDNSRQYHIDLWTGSTTVNGGNTQIECENSLPGGQQTIVRNPSNSFEMDTNPFFASGNCNRKTFPWRRWWIFFDEIICRERTRSDYHDAAGSPHDNGEY
ncbi:MAG: hypothetical protein L6R40_006376 [Gallowayella cf. fulva]|nr:MAG: hypothetical protein L6R40_006376 [Xanthomendoza cf. fulva]